MAMPAMSVSDEILTIFAARGAAAYFGEQVSTIEHVQQAAHFARADGAGNALIVAALLHDIGHLLHDAPDDIADWHSDARHEEIGSAWLARRFGRDVTDPVRLHVAAKRYLCAVDPNYLGALSPASILSLKLQGGPFTPDEARTFKALPFAAEAARLRRYDDVAKIEHAWTPDLKHYRTSLEAGLKPENQLTSTAR